MGSPPRPLGAAELDSLGGSAAAFLDLLHRRYACKKFDEAAKLEPAAISYILECVRLAPSSFGLEHTRAVAVVDRSLRSRLALACGGQDPVATAPLVLVLCARRCPAYEPGSAFVRERSERFPGGHAVFEADYHGYYEFLSREDRLDHWARAQTYIALANAMNAAAALDLDSCAIEGYDEAAVLDALEIDPELWLIGILVTVGRADEPRRESIRLPLGDMAEIR